MINYAILSSHEDADKIIENYEAEDVPKNDLWKDKLLEYHDEPLWKQINVEIP